MECRLCGSTDLRFYYNQGALKQYTYYRCNKCHLVNLDLSDIDVYANQEKYSGKYIDPRDKALNIGSTKTYAYIKQHIGHKGLFLDIGCGNGALLNIAKQDSWQVKGLEISAFLATKIKENLNIEVDVANFLEYDNFTDHYDLVCLRHVLEHLPNPILALQKINELLKPGGYAVLEFPNIEALSFQNRRHLANLKLHYRRYKANYVPGHCNEYSHKSFEYLTKHCGFHLVNWSTYSSNPILNEIYRLISIGTKARVLIKKLN